LSFAPPLTFLLAIPRPDRRREWLESYGEVALKPSTFTGYWGILRRYLGPLEGRRIDEVTLLEVKDLLLAKLKEGPSGATVTRIRALISTIFSQAV
jgi:hypothetical protein